MKQLEQLRAAHALNHVGTLRKEAINSLPGLILANGLLATLAFCEASSSGDNRGDQKQALLVMADFLAAQEVLQNKPSGLTDLLEELTSGSADQLQRVTDESLAYLSYLKRFARKQPREDSP